jgi:cytochrome c553
MLTRIHTTGMMSAPPSKILNLLVSSIYRLSSCALLFLLSLPAYAATPSAYSPPASIPGAAHVCAACHGSQGAGKATGIPRIGGMNANYLAHALAAFKAGRRRSKAMQPIARALSDTNIVTVSKYFAAQDPPLAPSPQPPSPDWVTAGKTLAVQGAEKNIPACFECHGMNARKTDQLVPSIAGEPAIYVVRRLHAFQALARVGAPKPGSMTDVASKLTDTQVRNVAAYLSVTPPK